MPLEDYKRKRKFEKTPEPKPRVKKTGARRLSFVVQKHAARRLHYDFRLELNGVLKSWAVPKGPSLDPHENRLAVHVEDHPLEYAGFEGVIPEGNYGAGRVIVWDRGTWLPDGDPEAGYRKGHLSFELQGEKLRGGWNLFRISREGKSDNWILRKREDHDAAAKPAGNITEEKPYSVASGRAIEQAEESGRSWTAEGEVKVRIAKKSKERKEPALVLPPTAPKAAFPAWVSPQLATPSAAVPEGGRWLHEIKFDGYRLLVFKNGRNTRLLTRQAKDWTEKFPGIAHAMSSLPIKSGVFDGEAVVLDKSGRSDFQALQNALKTAGGANLRIFLFDLLYLNGRDLREEPLESRKALLRQIVDSANTDEVAFSDHIEGNGEAVLDDACRLGLEGIVSKDRKSPYRSRRTRSWVKVKCQARQDFVIIGWTKSSAAGFPFGALHLGFYGKDGKTLHYAGKVGTGFDTETRGEIARRLRALTAEKPPKLEGRAPKGAIWVRPEILAEVEFTEWTADGRLRHPSFKGLREDLNPKDVKRERPANPPSDSEGKKKALSSAVVLSHPERSVYPGTDLSKAELAEYFEFAAPRMLPLMCKRPLVLVRCPEGSSKCFYQKQAGSGMEGFKKVPIVEGGKSRNYVYIEKVEDLVLLVQLNVLEIHLWGSAVGDIERPDRLIFDLDPDPAVEWESVAAAAFGIRAVLEELSLRCFVKSTGGKGLHIAAPIRPVYGWGTIKGFARRVCEILWESDRERYVLTMGKAKRKGKIYLDFLRNSRGASSIAPYSTRAREGAPISAPLGWDELSQRPSYYVADAEKLLRRSDPWADLPTTKQSISTKALRFLGLAER